MASPLDIVSTYFFAKDGNRPFLMRRVFAPDIEVELIVKTEAIVFPPKAHGLHEVEDVLSRRFASDFENVYSFCLRRPGDADRQHFRCRWLVGMSAKGNGPLRVGCGKYDWHFRADESCLVERLVITIDLMAVLPPEATDKVMLWLAGIPYPWCTPVEALETLPRLVELEKVRMYLERDS